MNKIPFLSMTSFAKSTNSSSDSDLGFCSVFAQVLSVMRRSISPMSKSISFNILEPFVLMSPVQNNFFPFDSTSTVLPPMTCPEFLNSKVAFPLLTFSLNAISLAFFIMLFNSGRSNGWEFFSIFSMSLINNFDRSNVGGVAYTSVLPLTNNDGTFPE